MKPVMKYWAVMVLLVGGTWQTKAAVFFSHMLEGSASNKAIAVYNGNDTVLDLTDYSIARYNNGSLVATDTYNFSNEGFNTLLPGEVFVVANPSANQAILDQANDTHTITFFNGDDAIALLDDGVVIDVIGEIGVDPGSGWAVGSGTTNNTTLSRNSTICAGQTDWTLGTIEWDVYPIDTTDGINVFLPVCQPVNLFISEYIDGPDSNQAIEIYNSGPFAINLETLRLTQGQGGLIFGDFLSGFMAADEVLVVSNPNADNSEVVNASDISHPVAVFDGNDSFTLNVISVLSGQGFRNQLDQFGLSGADPGPGGWPVSGGSTNDSTLIRQKQVCIGGANWGANANQWQTYTNNYYADLGSHNIRDCSEPAPSLVWVWSFDTEQGLFVTDGSVADASSNFDFDIFELKVLNTALPSLLNEQFIEFQPFQGFSWDGSVPTQFYRLNGSLTNGASFFTLTGPAYGLVPAPSKFVLTSNPDRGGGANLAQGVITVVLDIIFVSGLEQN